MQQALLSSTTIFIMIDCFGKSRGGTAVGINETVGYMTISVVDMISKAIMDVSALQMTFYYIVIGMIVIGIVLGVVAPKGSKDAAEGEEAEDSGKNDSADEATLSWATGRAVTFSNGQPASVYMSFINSPLMSINFAGQMTKFISGLLVIRAVGEERALHVDIQTPSTLLTHEFQCKLTVLSCNGKLDAVTLYRLRLLFSGC